MAEVSLWPPPPITFSPPPVCYPRNHLQTVGWLLVNEIVNAHEKCPPARYMKVWNCRLLFALSPVPQKLFLLLLTARLNLSLMAATDTPPNRPSWSLDCFCFQVTSYLLLQLFQFLRACCMKTEGAGVTGSPGNIHKPQQRNDTEETEKPCQFHACWATRMLQTRLHQSNNQIKVLLH